MMGPSKPLPSRQEMDVRIPLGPCRSQLASRLMSTGPSSHCFIDNKPEVALAKRHFVSLAAVGGDGVR